MMGRLSALRTDIAPRLHDILGLLRNLRSSRVAFIAAEPTAMMGRLSALRTDIAPLVCRSGPFWPDPRGDLACN
ncbi:uncharacterized protein EMH_0062440 [Eimeria mitis]|uniref:Uncharacterized protein n=1 Tax=Eimeria mitis TaxID=44415 RepID=U6K625_9EIME|nr:uncharacterized protein EMH_0062440 [Eimeria mitis]CDJ30923.1 hypothetical protein EMH_0062440 [Eimeria mitis]